MLNVLRNKKKDRPKPKYEVQLCFKKVEKF